MVAIFLLLGAVVNVAVAWGCALGLPLVTKQRWGPLGRGWSSETVPYWYAEEMHRAGAQRFVFLSVSFDFSGSPGTDWGAALDVTTEDYTLDMRSLPGWMHIDTTVPPEVENEFEMFVEDARGWPSLALSSHARVQEDPRLRVRGGIIPGAAESIPGWTGSFYFEDYLFGRQILPLTPIWPGFAINTLFYAAILWLPIRGPFALRRFIRRNRGQCVVCGYDLRGDFARGCSECGWRRETDALRAPP